MPPPPAAPPDGAAPRSDAPDLARRLSLLAEQTVHGVILTDTGGRTEWVNRGFEEMCGYTLDELRGRAPGHRLQGPGTDPDTVAQMNAWLRDREPFVTDVLNYAKGGRAYWARMDVSPLYDDGRFVGYAAIETDVTEEREATARLQGALDRERELNELTSRFVSMVSHEFRTPLTTIQSSAELVERYAPDDDRTAKHLGRIRQSVGHLAGLLEDVVAVNRDGGAPALQAEPVDLAALVSDLVDEVRDGAGSAHRVALAADGDAAVTADPKRLRTVVLNLLGNAVKYSEPGSRVGVRVDATGPGAVRVVVEDEGVGIDPADLGDLFEPFRRGRNVGAARGNGLGLSIARRAARDHGGDVAVESALGRGTTATVTVPRTPAPPDRAAAGGAADGAGGAGGAASGAADGGGAAPAAP